VVNWRAMPLHSFGYEVQCGGCEAWVTNVSAKDVADAQAGKGRCRDCVVKSPVVVEVPAPAAVEEPVEAGEPEEAAVEEEAAPAGWGAEDAADSGEPEGAPLKDDPAAGPRRKR